MSGFPGNFRRNEYSRPPPQLFQQQQQQQQQQYQGYSQNERYNQDIGHNQAYPQQYYPQGFQPQQGRYNRPAAQLNPQQVSQYAQTQSVFQQEDPAQHVNFEIPHNVSQPSTRPQSFGVDGYNYQYSNCTGRRKALLVGINYIGTNNALRGCINDVNTVKQFLIKNGYNEGDIVMLTDDQHEMVKVPIRANIIKAIGWLVADAQPNDALFFHYSGHGSQVRDEDGDEEDGIDETIVPLDFETAGQIVDDELHARMVAPLKPGVRLTALFDSCHSGSVLDLPYMYSTKGVLKEPNLTAEAGQGLLTAAFSYLRGDNAGVMSGLKSLVTLATQGGNEQQAYEKTKRTKTSPADVVMFSGSKDDQTSADATEGGVPTGAMSYSFIKVMSNTPQQTYLSLLQNMRKILSEKYIQKPQFSSSHPIDVNLQFIF